MDYRLSNKSEGGTSIKSVEVHTPGIFHQKAPYANLSASSSSTISDPFRICAPPDMRTNLQNALREFTLAYLTEQPKDIIDYAVEHFKQIQKSRKKALAINENLQDRKSTQYDPLIISKSLRRPSVCAECYDPDEDDSTPVVIKKTQEQYSRLTKSVKEVVIFRHLEEEQLKQVLDAMFEKRIKRGEIVIEQGDDGDFFYVIEKGHFDIYKDGEHVFSWKDAGAFGEIALMYQVKRTATVQAITDGWLWALDRQSFRRILLKYSYKKQKMYVKFLENMSLLKNLDTWERFNIAEVLEPRTYEAGEVIITQGDVGDGMYFIERGQVQVCKEKETGSTIVNRLGPSQYFGELALLMYDRRKATVIADTHVKVAFLNKESFERMLGKCIDILKRAIADYNLQDDEK